MEASFNLEKNMLGELQTILSHQKSPKLAYELYFLSLNHLGILNHRNISVTGERNLVDKTLPKFIKTPKPVFFDVGSYHGKYAQLLNWRFPNAIIHCFEPHPKNFKILEQLNISNIVSHKLGVGDKSGRSIIYDRSDIDGSSHASLYSRVIQDIHKQDLIKYDVEIVTIDEIIEKEKISHIDFLKIDTEGHELSVLKGALKAIKNGVIRSIQFEFNEMNVVSRSFFKDFKDILKDFVFYRLLPNGLLKLEDQPVLTEIFAFQNIFAIPSYLLK